MKGFVTLSKVQLADGKIITTQQAVDYGWIRPAGVQKPGWGLERHEVPLGHNLFVDEGRQLLAYCFGGRAPLSNFFLPKVWRGDRHDRPQGD
jgi:hypothetical protein